MPCNFISSCFFIESPWNRDQDCAVAEESRAAAAAVVEGVPGGGGGGGQQIPDGAVGGWNLRLGDRNQRHQNHPLQNFEEDAEDEDPENPWHLGQQQPVPEPAGRPNIRGRRASSGPINQQPGNNVNTAGTISAQNGGVATENGTSPTGKEAGTKAGSHTRAAKTFRAYLPSCHRTYSCVHCRAHLANHDELISKSFQGSQGRAYLFNSVVNIGCGPAEERVLLTGLHAVADIYCDCCKTTLGWKYEQAYESSQKYKEGKFIIELAHMIKENGWENES